MKTKLQMSENMLLKKWLAVKWQLYAHLKKNYFSLSLTPKYNIDVKQACISLCMSMLSIPFSMAVKNYENGAIIRFV
jgi:hypothetical protein